MNNNKRILLITDIFPPQIGGPALFIDRMASYLYQIGYKVTVICSSEGYYTEHDKLKKYRIKRANISKRYFYEVQIRYILLFQLLTHKHILVNGMEKYMYPIARFLNKSYILKIVGDKAWESLRNKGFTTYNIDEFQLKHSEFPYCNNIIRERLNYITQAKYIITPSNYLKNLVISWGVSESKIRTIYNSYPIQGEGKTIYKRNESEIFNILFIGRLTNWKGVETILLAIKEMKNIKLSIIGDGPELPLLKDLSDQMELFNKVQFYGRLSESEIKPFLKSSHVLVLVSLYEGLSHTIIEAMAQGVPCIASSCGGNTETITHGKSGFLIDAHSVNKLKETLEFLINNEEYRQATAQEAMNESKKFDFQNMANTILTLFYK
jgi:glycosyltransferase involved in cell wall biosynthesis